jgi:hypothetical protein
MCKIMGNEYHKHYIHHPGRWQKGHGSRARTRLLLGAFSALLLVLAGCDPVAIVEGSDTHVSIRYDGPMNGLDRATELAQKACAEHGRTARLRQTYQEGLGIGERFAFFDCV